MPKLIRKGRKLARLGSKFVLDTGGAPCCCGPGCTLWRRIDNCDQPQELRRWICVDSFCMNGDPVAPGMVIAHDGSCWTVTDITDPTPPAELRLSERTFTCYASCEECRGFPDCCPVGCGWDASQPPDALFTSWASGTINCFCFRADTVEYSEKTGLEGYCFTSTSGWDESSPRRACGDGGLDWWVRSKINMQFSNLGGSPSRDFHCDERDGEWWDGFTKPPDACQAFVSDPGYGIMTAFGLAGRADGNFSISRGPRIEWYVAVGGDGRGGFAAYALDQNTLHPVIDEFRLVAVYSVGRCVAGFKVYGRGHSDCGTVEFEAEVRLPFLGRCADAGPESGGDLRVTSDPDLTLSDPRAAAILDQQSRGGGCAGCSH